MAEAGSCSQSQEEQLLDCVQVTPAHLASNGSIHSSPCAGIAELIDNAVDSQAKTVFINTSHTDRVMPDGQPNRVRYITVADDGQGMDREEALKTILVGYSLKRGDVGMIGQFGNGLKSGSMRVGKTMLLCTLKDREYTILMISLPFLETLGGNKCLVPCISYKVDEYGKELSPMKCTNEKVEKHTLALSIILQWSPFATEVELHDFIKLNIPAERKSGTVVVLSDLRRLENNQYELQCSKDDMYVKRRGEDEKASKGTEEGSEDTLSGFLKNLYLDPKAVIYIHNRQVRLLEPLRSYASPRWALLSDNVIRSFVEREKENVNKDIKKLQNEALPIQQRLKKIEAELSIKSTDKELRAEQRRKTGALDECNKQIMLLTDRLNSKGKDKPGADIRVYFGMDVERRAERRAIFYSSGRRVLEHPIKANGAEAFKKVMGVVCTVNIPSTLLPTKQHRESFETKTDFDVIVRKIEKHARTYFEHVDEHYKDPLFWKGLGYDEREFNQFDIPNLRDEEVERKIFELMGSGRRQCERCREFRPVTWEQFIEEQSRACMVYRCTQTLPGGECVPKTAAQKSAEVIRELNTKGAPTYFKELAKPSKAAQNNRSRIDSISSEDNGRRPDRMSCSERRPAHNTSNLRPSRFVPLKPSINLSSRSSTTSSRSKRVAPSTQSSTRSSSRSKGWTHPYSASEGERNDEDDDDEEEDDEVSVVSSTRTRRTTRSNVSRSSSNSSKRNTRMHLSTSRSSRKEKNRRSESEDEGSEQEDEEEEDDVEEQGGEDEGDDARSGVPLYLKDANDGANDGQESVVSHSTFSTLIGGRQQPLFRGHVEMREDQGQMMDGDQRTTSSQSSHTGAFTGLEKKRKMEEEREKNGAVESKKPRASLDGFKIPKKDPTEVTRRTEEWEEQWGERSNSIVPSRNTSGGYATMDESMDNVYARDYEQKPMAGDDLLEMDHSDITNAIPRQSMMARLEALKGLKVKTNEELMATVLHVQDMMNQMKREKEDKEEELEKEKVERAAEVARLHEDMERKEEEIKRKDEELKKEKAERAAQVADMNKEKEETEEELVREKVKRAAEADALRDVIKMKEEGMTMKDHELEKEKAERAAEVAGKEEMKRKEEEMKRKEEEMKRKEEEMKRKDEEMKRMDEKIDMKDQVIARKNEEIAWKGEERKKEKAERAAEVAELLEKLEKEKAKALREMKEEYESIMEITAEMKEMLAEMAKVRDTPSKQAESGSSSARDC